MCVCVSGAAQVFWFSASKIECGGHEVFGADGVCLVGEQHEPRRGTKCIYFNGIAGNAAAPELHCKKRSTVKLVFYLIFII